MKMGYFILFCLAVNNGCNNSKISSIQSDKKDHILIAISDFSNSNKLYNNYNVFRIWKYRFPDSKIICVSISRSNGKILWSGDTSGIRDKHIPSRYFEKGGKLFYWWDEAHGINDTTISILNKYGVLQDDDNGNVKLLEPRNDDSQKAFHYYFCKDEFVGFKKVITNLGVGYYEIPSLKCKN